jgi:hypothetical protein
MAKKYYRNPYRRKDGTWVRGGWVRGRNPKSGCSFWLLGLVALAAGVFAALLG